MGMDGYFAHPSSCIDAGASIGSGTKIWHYSHVSVGAQIGEGCTLGQNVYVAPNVRIGNGVKIQNNVSIYEGVTLEDYVFLGPSMVFTNVRTPRAAFPCERPQGFELTHVGCGASIGANATVVCGVRIGSWALIGAGSVVTRDVAAHALLLGVPARAAGWVCCCGRRLSVSQLAGRCEACARRYVESRDGGLELVE